MPIRRPTLLAALAALALTGCSDGAPAAAPPGVASGTLRVADPAGGQGPIRLADATRLLVEGSYRGDPGPHAVRVDVTGPSGVLYTQLRGTLVAGPDGAGTSATALEVRGTPIDAYRMVGAWSFALVVDDQPLASATFEVKP